ncbi:MAG: DMT family transporter [Lachnospiraceae bacterium]|nr:DMT family transporter [Lachnospiraceae bacterium]
MKKRAVLSVNLAVLLFGLAGLFAKWIRLPAIFITFGRVLFSSAALGIYMLIRRQSFRIARKDAALLIPAGGILALHWWSFLKAVQLSTVAVGTATFAAFPLFVTFLEPLVFRRKPDRRSIVTAVVILIGVLITVPEFSVENRTFLGILTGLLSALSYAVLVILNKRAAGRMSGTVITFYEQAAAAAILLPFALSVKAQPSGQDLALLLFLGVVTTALAHTLFVSSLKTLPAQLAGICSSMETVYGILFAFLLLGEVPAGREIAGAAVIVGAVVIA